MNKMIKIEKRAIHSQNQELVANMKLLLIILLAVACQAYTLIAERSWVKFRKSKTPDLRKLSSTRGTRHYSCNRHSN